MFAGLPEVRHAQDESLVDCRCRRIHANGPRLGLRMERFSHPSHQRIWLEHHTSHLDISDQLVFSWVSAYLGGLLMKRRHPRVVAMTAGLLWGGGVFLASFAGDKLWWLYLSYGVIGGIGLGMGYVVPIAVLGEMVS